MDSRFKSNRGFVKTRQPIYDQLVMAGYNELEAMKCEKALCEASHSMNIDVQQLLNMKLRLERKSA